MANFLLACSNPVAGLEDEFNDWYTNIHLPEIVALDGFASATRYKLSDAEIPGMAACPWAYLAVYTLDTDPATAVATMMDAVHSGSIVVPESMDMESARAWVFEEISAPSGSVDAQAASEIGA